MYNYKALFNNYKQCAVCKRPLPNDYKEDLCPHCLESQLFNEVKEYMKGFYGKPPAPVKSYTFQRYKTKISIAKIDK